MTRRTHIPAMIRTVLCGAWLLSANLTFSQVTGDVNADGVVNLTDASLIRDHLLEKTPLTGAALTRADCDGDGKVRMADLVYVDNHLYGTITINVTPDSGSWQLTGPTAFSPVSGTGDRTGANAIKNLPLGAYTLSCNDNVAGFDPPPSETKTLTSGGTVAFTPTYTPTITITLPGNVPLVLLRIPAGQFPMGSPDAERSRDSDEGPVHTVTFDEAFYIGKYELTQRQWLAVMGSWPGNAPSTRYGLGDDYPAYNVSWNDAQNFLTALNTHVTSTGQGPATFRLPSEAEWEYACRGGTQWRFFFGDSLSVADSAIDGPAGGLTGNRSDYMWFGANNSPYGTKAAGTKQRNQFGLYDMSGNVWEWCQDWYHSSYTGAPTDGSAWNTQAPSLPYRIVRGGDWAYGADACRSASRNASDPGSRSVYFGFRIVRPE